MENPSSGLHEKVVGYHFSQKLKMLDPHTRKKEEKPLKPFMVNNSVIVFEHGKIVLNPEDEKFKEDLEGYRIKGTTSTGAPIFSDENEHTIDAMNLCLLIFEQNHGELFRNLVNTRMYSIDGLNPEKIKIVERRFEVEEEQQSLVVGLDRNGNSTLRVIRDKKRSRRKITTRSNF